MLVERETLDHLQRRVDHMPQPQQVLQQAQPRSTHRQSLRRVDLFVIGQKQLEANHAFDRLVRMHRLVGDVHVHNEVGASLQLYQLQQRQLAG